MGWGNPLIPQLKGRINILVAFTGETWNGDFSPESNTKRRGLASAIQLVLKCIPLSLSVFDLVQNDEADNMCYQKQTLN